MKKILVWGFIILTGILLFYVWYGFLFPDPAYLAQYGLIAKLKYLWIPRIFIPLFYCTVVLVVLLHKNKLVQDLSITFFTVILLTIIIYAISSVRSYSKSKYSNQLISSQYHPYLQLKPSATDHLDTLYDDETFKIFCLGGSTTEFGNSKGIAWPDRLENELRDTLKSDKIIVYNAGKQWYTTLHSLINYEVNLRHHKPDLIIIMHNINDLLQNADFSHLSNGDFRADYGHFFGPVVNMVKKQGPFDPLWTNFRRMWFYKPVTVVETDSFPGLESYTRNINTIIDLALMDSSQVMLLTQPNVYTEEMSEEIKRACTMVNFEAVGDDMRWGFKTALDGMREYNDRLKDISEKRDVYYVDLEQYIPKSLTYFKDDVHYMDTTFTIISKVLTEEIVRGNIIR